MNMGTSGQIVPTKREIFILTKKGEKDTRGKAKTARRVRGKGGGGVAKPHLLTPTPAQSPRRAMYQEGGASSSNAASGGGASSTNAQQ